MTKQNITLISFENFEKGFLGKIAEDVKREFHFPVNIKESRIDLNEFYNPTRRQYDGNKLLNEMESGYSSVSFKTIGLFRVDIFIPILTYIYGQAILNGSTGIASIYRLKNELYGMKQDENLLLERFSKVVIHELGHTLGLIHCHIPTCVMRASTYVEILDQKSKNLCPLCRKELKIY